MQSTGLDLNAFAHLFVAAIRVPTHQKGIPPSVESVCRTLQISEERGNHICRKLGERAIVEVVEGAFGTKLFVKNYLAIEEIPKGETDRKFDDALKKFQAEKKDLSKKIESFQAQQEEKKKKLIADLDKQLQKGKD